MVKRIICLLMALLFISSNCFAQDIIFKEITEKDYPMKNGVFLNADETQAEEVQAQYIVSFFSDLSFEEYIAEFILESGELPEKISGLSKYDIPKSKFADKYFDVALKYPELLIATDYDVSEVVSGTDIVESIIPVYVVDSKAAADTARSQMKAAVKEYTDLASAYNTDLEKMLVIHDKMVADCAYDERENDKDVDISVWKNMHHALGVLRDKKAVCQGFSQALYMIAKELEIELDFCYSKSGDHMWNYVKIDGEWYHMDMTNDDPALAGGEATHDYFMLSDASLASSIHGSDRRSFSGKTYNCTDTKYESDHFFNTLIPFTAQRAEDGYFSASLNLVDEGEGIDTTVQFKSKTLYTGPVIQTHCITDRKYTQVTDSVATEKTERALYIMAYPTKALEKTMVISRYDNKNAISMLRGISLLPNELLILRIASGVPEDVPLSFTAFIWNEDTLAPYAEKAMWTQK